MGAAMLAVAAAADEIRLKDGTKIVGTIVGFEENSFKVQTSYGYALVRREHIAAIVMNDPTAKKPAEPATEDAKAKPPAVPAPDSKPTGESKKLDTAPPAPAPQPQAAAPQAAPAVSDKSTQSTAKPRQQNPTASVAQPAAAPAKQPEPPPPPPPPEPMRDEVQGTTYINHTYAFRLYKPPGWRVVEGAHQRIPNALVAMATPDETTMLVISLEPLKGSVESHADSAERELRANYENYRALGQQRTTVAGLAALERRFRASVDAHDWSGRVVWIARGNEVLTLFGMTHAESDLIQIQENVIARAISSLEFTVK